jgi:hypothetical protein
MHIQFAEFQGCLDEPLALLDSFHVVHGTSLVP